MTQKKFTGESGDITTIGGAFLDFLDAVVRTSVERIEAQRSANGRSGGPAAFDRKGAADYLAIGTTTLDRLRAEGQIKTVNVAGMPRYTRATLDRYLHQQERGGR